MTGDRKDSTLATVLTWLVVGVIAIVALKAAFWVLGSLAGLAMFLLFTVGPIVLVAWLLYKFVKLLSRPSEA